MRCEEGPRHSHLNPESEPEQRPRGSSRLDGDASIGHAGAAPRPGQSHPGRLDRAEDRGALPDTGGSAAGVDRRGPGADAHEPDPVDARGERRRGAGLSTCAPPRPAAPPDAAGAGHPGTPAGAAPPGGWPAPGPVGWPDAGGPPETAVWHPAAGAPGSDVAAPVGLPPETGQLYVPPSPRRGRPPVPADPKKNSRPWGPTTPSSSKMRLASPCIPVWAAAGGNAATGCGSPRPASIGPASISPAGWRPAWAAPGWCGPRAAIAPGSSRCSATSTGGSGAIRSGSTWMGRGGITATRWTTFCGRTAGSG